MVLEIMRFVHSYNRPHLDADVDSKSTKYNTTSLNGQIINRHSESAPVGSKVARFLAEGPYTVMVVQLHSASPLKHITE